MTLQQIFDILVGIAMVVSVLMLIVSVICLVGALFFQPTKVADAPDDVVD